MPRMLRAVLVLFAAFTVGGTAVAVVPAAVGAASVTAHAAKPHKKKHKKKKPAKPPKPVTLARSAVVKYHNVKISRKRTVRSALLRFDIRNASVRLGAAIPGNAVGAGRQTITTLTRANRAVGGVNADFFKSGQPLGGLVVDGVMLKSPRTGWDANFYVRNGRAAIGPVNFTGSVVRAARPATEPDPPTAGDPPSDPVPAPPPPAPATSRGLTSINAVRDLAGDRLVLINAGLAAPQFGRACAVALVSSTPAGTVPTPQPPTPPTISTAGSTVTAVFDGVASIPRLAGADFALVACGTGARANWLRNNIAVGDTLAVTTALAGGTPSTLVSGGRMLVKNGRTFNDSDGKTITGRNPETFGCVSKYGTKIILGTIDGRREGSSGVTLRELTRYLLRLKCWSGIVFDGGGSSTLVGQPAGRVGVRVLNKPSDRGGARAVTTGLLLYRR